MLMLKERIFVILIVFLITKCNSSNNTKVLKTNKCPSIFDANINNGGGHCCNSTYKRFRRSYLLVNVKLTSLMEKLKAWNCPQFKDECKYRNFDYNRFTFLVYEKFCNNSNFKRICKNEMKTFYRYLNNMSLTESGMVFTLFLNFVSLLFLMK